MPWNRIDWMSARVKFIAVLTRCLGVGISGSRIGQRSCVRSRAPSLPPSVAPSGSRLPQPAHLRECF